MEKRLFNKMFLNHKRGISFCPIFCNLSNIVLKSSLSNSEDNSSSKKSNNSSVCVCVSMFVCMYVCVCDCSNYNPTKWKIANKDI